MNKVGIEQMNIFGGSAFLQVDKLVEHRKLDIKRFDNLLMVEKTVALPFEDPITFGVNAAQPIIDALSVEEKNRIELLITCTESGIDFGKSISTYIHHYLGLSKNCRLFEIKQACYSGTAGFQMAINFILSNVSPGAKALVISSDISRFVVEDAGEALSADWSYAEPSAGAGAVALLISDNPVVFEVDQGANGYFGYEVMDTCRPAPDSEAGDVDLSLLSYLDCCEKSFEEYRNRVSQVDYLKTFQYLAFHTPFGGMVKGAHRANMRKFTQANVQDIENDFLLRVMPGIKFCQRVGNIMGGTIFLSLLSTIENGHFDAPKRVGCFSYGSGCCSEFYSGIVNKLGAESLKSFGVKSHLENRYELSMTEYEDILKSSGALKFGTRNVLIELDIFSHIINSFHREKQLVLEEINEFHRIYKWQ